MANREAIRASALAVLYRAAAGNVLALRGIDVEIAAGEVVCVIGPSGSGKSTLVRCLAGQQAPSAGALRAFGVDLHTAGPRALARYRAETVGVVHQHYFRALSPDLRAEDAVAVKAALLGWPRRSRRHRAQQLVRCVGLEHRRAARRHELSGGEQQRVAVCAALVTRPRLLLADEPTGELDTATGGEILRLIGDLAQAQNTTVVLVSHDPAAAEIADRVLTLRDGWLVSERHPGGPELTLVDPGGLLRLDPHHRAQAGIGSRALQQRVDSKIVLTGTEPSESPPHHPRREQRTRRSVRAPATRPAVTLASVGRVYGEGASAIRALRDLSLRLSSASFHVLAGRSGSGKTTLLYLIAGLEHPDEGAVTVLEHALATLTRTQLACLRRRAVAIVPQTPALTPFLTAAENVALAGLIRGFNASAAERAAREAIAAVELGSRADYRVDALSKGEQQRVAIARALAGAPALLLADEPTAALDQDNAVAVGSLLARVAQERGTTVICATHDPLVIDQAHHIHRLDSGRLVTTATPSLVLPAVSSVAFRRRVGGVGRVAGLGCGRAARRGLGG